MSEGQVDTERKSVSNTPEKSKQLPLDVCTSNTHSQNNVHHSTHHRKPSLLSHSSIPFSPQVSNKRSYSLDRTDLHLLNRLYQHLKRKAKAAGLSKIRKLHDEWYEDIDPVEAVHRDKEAADIIWRIVRAELRRTGFFFDDSESSTSLTETVSIISDDEDLPLYSSNIDTEAPSNELFNPTSTTGDNSNQFIGKNSLHSIPDASHSTIFSGTTSSSSYSQQYYRSESPHSQISQFTSLHNIPKPIKSVIKQRRYITKKESFLGNMQRPVDRWYTIEDALEESEGSDCPQLFDDKDVLWTYGLTGTDRNQHIQRMNHMQPIEYSQNSNTIFDAFANTMHNQSSPNNAKVSQKKTCLHKHMHIFKRSFSNRLYLALEQYEDMYDDFASLEFINPLQTKMREQIHHSIIQSNNQNNIDKLQLQSENFVNNNSLHHNTSTNNSLHLPLSLSQHLSSSATVEVNQNIQSDCKYHNTFPNISSKSSSQTSSNRIHAPKPPPPLRHIELSGLFFFCFFILIIY